MPVGYEDFPKRRFVYPKRDDGKYIHVEEYSKHYGEPKRSYYVWHVDGNPLNNRKENLVAVQKSLYLWLRDFAPREPRLNRTKVLDYVYRMEKFGSIKEMEKDLWRMSLRDSNRTTKKGRRKAIREGEKKIIEQEASALRLRKEREGQAKQIKRPLNLTPLRTVEEWLKDNDPKRYSSRGKELPPEDKAPQ